VQSQVELFQQLVDFSPDALLVVDAGGLIVYANTQAERLFGYEPNHLLNLSVDSLLPRRLRQRHGDHRRDYASDPRTREMGASLLELSAARRDGFEFPVEIRLSTISVGGQQLTAAAVRDVSERRIAAALLRAARDEAQQANTQKGRFLASASHDLRQPLQTLQLLNGVLLRQVDDATAVQLLGNQRDVLASMSGLLNNLLDIGRIEAGNISLRIEDVNMADLFRDLQIEFDTVASAQGIAFTVEGCSQAVRTDRILFRQILENLVSNALKYTVAGSVTLSCAVRSGDLAIEVTDTGIGIAPHQLTSVFDEFYQVRRRSNHPGVGLGLAIVKRLVDSLGLSIDVTSTLGVGSSFCLLIPARMVSDAVPHQPADKTSATLRPVPDNTVVLLVEDDDAVRRATALYLKTIGLVTLAAASIADARRVLLGSQRPPDIIISDYHLGPDETGLELIEFVRSMLGKPLPALLLSGDTSAALHDQSQTVSCRVLSKPVDAELLGSTIAELLSADASGRDRDSATPAKP
jgi:two-component system, sensor histidine kinase